MTNVTLPFWYDRVAGWLIVPVEDLEPLGISPADLTIETTAHGKQVALRDGHDSNLFIAKWAEKHRSITMAVMAYQAAPPRAWQRFGQKPVDTQPAGAAP